MVLSGKTFLSRVKLPGRVSGFTLTAAAALAATVGLSTAVALAQSNLIAIDGSSTVFPITEAMAEEFMVANGNVNISVGVSGTGGGFQKFCAGETVISNASRPIKDTEIEACAAAGITNIKEIEVAYDAITVVVHPNNDWADNMTVAQLQALWSPDSNIDSWDDIDPAFPAEPISLYGPGADSGTFDYFTDEIVGEEGASRGDYTASEDDNVLVLGVSRNENALGYFGMAYYEQNQDILKAVGISSEATNGEFIVPSADTIEQYIPLARPIFIYVNEDEMASRPEVRSFVEFYLNKAQENDGALISEVGYVPFPAADYQESLGSL